MKVVGLSKVSPRGKVTLIELGQSINTWPQLASSVVMGGGVVADISRKILLNQLSVSGRYYIDVEEIIKEPTPYKPAFIPSDIKPLTNNDIIHLANQIPAGNNSVNISIHIIKKIVSDAGTAPSSGNDQPWKFLFYNNRLFLFHEESRSFSFGDYKNMASFTTLGMCIENVVLSAHHYNFEVNLTIFPLKDNQQCIAVFDFLQEPNDQSEKHEEDYLYDFIFARCTNRKIVPNDAAPLSVLEQLTQTTETIFPAKNYWITDKPTLKQLGKIISAIDRIRVMHPHGHYDFFNREMRWTKEDAELKKTGMDVSTMELPQQAMMALQVIRNNDVMNVLRDINGMQAFKWVSIPKCNKFGRYVFDNYAFLYFC